MLTDCTCDCFVLFPLFALSAASQPSKKPIAEIWCLCNDKCLVPREESREVFKIEIQEGKVSVKQICQVLNMAR